MRIEQSTKNHVEVTIPTTLFSTGQDRAVAEHDAAGRRRVHLDGGHHRGHGGARHILLQLPHQGHHRPHSRGRHPGQQPHAQVGKPLTFFTKSVPSNEGLHGKVLGDAWQFTLAPSLEAFATKPII